MEKKHSMDIEDRIELLLRIMTDGCTKDSKNSTDFDYLISSDESDSESEGNDSVCSDLSESENEDDTDGKFRLNKFFEDQLEKTKKYVPSNAMSDTGNDLQFEKKMYRVIPIRIDKNIPKLKNPVTSSKKCSNKFARMQN